MRLPQSRAVLAGAVLLGVCMANPAGAAEGSATGPSAVSGPSSAVATASAANTVPVPDFGAYTGAAVNGSATQTWQDAFNSFEQASGRQLALHRTYQAWDSATISGLTKWDVANGHIPVVSISAPASASSWAAIANGSLDADIAKQADAFKAFGAPLLLSLNHEPELDAPGLGTPAEYRAAWQRWVGIYRAREATNVSFTWILTAASFSKYKYVADDYFPGDDVVDWLGVDGYNWFDVCKDDPWRSFDNVFADFRTWAARHPQPILIAEVGSAEDKADPQHKARWIADIPASLAAWPQVKAVSWFNFTAPPGTNDCQMRVASSPQSSNAWAGAVNQPYLLRSPADAQAATVAPSVGDATTATAGQQSAAVAAQVTTYGDTASMRVDYGTTDAYGSSAPLTTVPSSSTPTTATGFPSGLAPGSTYHYRVVVTNEAGTASSPDAVLQTQGAPTPTTQIPQKIEGYAASLAGTVAPGGLATKVTFALGTTTTYARKTTAVTVAAGLAAVPVVVPVTGLLPGTTYHVRMTATNAAGTVNGADVVFTTAPVPTVTTTWNGAQTTTGMTVHGSVDANGIATTYRFEYGRTSSYGSSSAAVSTSGYAPIKVEARLAGLASKTTYHYRLVAENAAGKAIGADVTGITG